VSLNLIKKGNKIFPILISSTVLLILFLPPVDANNENTTSSQSVTFSINAPEYWFSANFPINIVWNDYLKASSGDTVSIGYTLSGASASATITVPLSEWLGWLGIGDVPIDIPLGNTIIGSIVFSLTELAGIPSWIGSLDLTMESSIEINQIICSSGSEDIQTDCSNVKWTSWSTKEIQVLADKHPGSTIETTFQYVLSLGLTLSLIGIDVYDVIPLQAISTVAGYPKVVTEIEVPQSSLTTYLAIGGISVGIIAAIFIIFFLLKRVKRTNTDSKKIDKTCSNCGKPVNNNHFCPHCGKEQ